MSSSHATCPIQPLDYATCTVHLWVWVLYIMDHHASSSPISTEEFRRVGILCCEVCVYSVIPMEAQMVRNVDRTSSIEWEPRTLKIHQIQSARDLAIYVLNTESMEEATRIFTEGLKPVVSGAFRMRSDSEASMGEEDLKLLNDRAEAEPAFRDIASAPF